MLRALTRAVRRRPMLVLAVTAAIAVLSAGYGHDVARRLAPYSVSDSASESLKVERALERATRFDPRFGVVAVVVLPGPVASPRSRSRVKRVATKLGADPGVAQVFTYYAAHSPELLARDRRSTAIVVNLRPGDERHDAAVAKRLLAAFAGDRDVRLGGEAIGYAQVADVVDRDLRRAELLAAPLLALLALIFFRGLVAAALPMVAAAVSVAVSYALLRVVAAVTPVTVFVLNLVIGLGLGLAIDYALLMVSRFREELPRHGGDADRAIGETLATAGRTVLFSSLTVAAALAALLVFPQTFIRSMGIGGIVVALTSGAIALTALPALLRLLGDDVNRWSLRSRGAERSDDPPSGRASVAAPGMWRRLATTVMRRPVIVTVAVSCLLLAIALPAARVRFVAADGSVLPASVSTRQVHDKLIRDFPANRTLPLLVLANTQNAGDARRVATVIWWLHGVSTVERSRPAGAAGTLIPVIPAGPPLSAASRELVRRIRALSGVGGLPRLTVGGWTAAFVDYRRSINRHLPFAIAIVVAVTLALVFLLTASVLLPLKTLLFNFVTVAAAFGLLVLVFQDGRLEGPLGYQSPGALEAAQPVILFAIVFGLATDYGVMLLSRIKELHDRGADTEAAIVGGLERTGRVITAAAIMFCVAVAAFATSRIIFIKELGLGTAAAVLIDATIVRALLTPATMAILSEWNWWAPPRLARLAGAGRGGEPKRATTSTP